MSKFHELGLSAEILKALDEIGFETPTEIQERAIPQLIESDPDMIGLAQTGTGKTAAFSLPLLDLIDHKSKHTQAIILAPTRELVQQIAVEIANFSKFKGRINISTVYGGTSISNQIREIKSRTPHIIIATPGRLIDLIGRRVVNLTSIDHLVLDEADEMLNMGFQEDIDKILEGTPEDKRTWLFSATMPKEIRSIVDTYMTDPIEVTVDQKNITNQNISHKYVLVNRRDKAEAVKRIVDFIPELYCVVFCRTKLDTQDLADELIKEGYRAEAIHGDLSQAQRDKVMRKFRSKSVNILVATDVAARGIDVNDLTHVIHYTLPDSPSYYTHRSGRTARAGKSGVSLTILIPKDKNKMKQIQRALKIEFERVKLPRYADLLNRRMEKWSEKLNNTDAQGLPEGLVERVTSRLENLSREEIIEKLVAQQFYKVRKKSNVQDDLNLEEYDSRERRDSKSKRRKDRDGRRSEERGRGRERGRSRDEGRGRDRKDRNRGQEEKKGRDRYQGKSKFVNMYINVGKMDKMSVGDILDFISKNGNVKKKTIGDIEMSKMHTVFQLDKKEIRTLDKHFKNITLKGRSIRCNVD